MTKSGVRLTNEDIRGFEERSSRKLTELYSKFLLENNGGYPEKSFFRISDEQGDDDVNVFFGIGGMYDNIDDNLRFLRNRIPSEFIPIADDPNGNIICLGISGEYYENIYWWDHEQESDIPDMSNMYYLAPDIYQFVENLEPSPYV